MSKPIVFVFHFNIDNFDVNVNNEYLSEKYGFLIKENGAKNIQDYIDSEDFYDDVIRPIEDEYGAHDDLSVIPFDKVKVLGFETYEIQGSYMKKCMKSWHEKMIELCGAENVSKKIYDLSKVSEDCKAEDFYNYMMKKGG